MTTEEFFLDGEAIRKEMKEEGGLLGQDTHWYATSERVMKYKSGTLDNEEIHDISIEKVTGISFGSSRDNVLLGISLLIITPITLLRYAPSELVSEVQVLGIFQENIVTLAGLAFGSIYLILWFLSKHTYLQIHGGESSDRWRIRSEMVGSDLSTGELRNFSKAIRREISR